MTCRKQKIYRIQNIHFELEWVKIRFKGTKQMSQLHSERNK